MHEEGLRSQDGEKVEVDGERVLTLTVERPPDSTIHTVMENLYLNTVVRLQCVNLVS